MNLSEIFPRLDESNHQVTSPRTIKYNCVAWAAGQTDRWWQPGCFWPIESARDDHGIGNLVMAFKSFGFEECEDGSLDPSVEKLALYGSSLMYTHVARQLPDGQWTSKLGQLEDIVHATAEVIAGGDYGEVVQYMRRARAPTHGP